MLTIQDKLYNPDSFEIAQYLLNAIREQYANQPTEAVLGGLWLTMQGLQGPDVAIRAIQTYLPTLSTKCS